jgi:hypothetical protein
MLILVTAGVFVVVLLALFFYRTVDMDIAGSIFAALLSIGLLGVLITGAIFAGRLF